MSPLHIVAGQAPTHTATAVGTPSACATTDQLDLQVSVSDAGNPGVPADYNPCTQAYLFPMFKIVNNDATAAVNVNTLSIVGWFGAGQASDTASVDACCSGQAYRTWVYTSLGAIDWAAMGTASGVSATAALATSGPYGASGQQVTFTFDTAGVTLPAGDFLMAGGGNPFSSSTPFMQLSVPGAQFDPGCDNYSNMTGGNGGVLYTPPSSPTSAYYQNSGWVLDENGIKVCEYTNSTTKDASTGIPATGAGCSCASEVGGPGGGGGSGTATDSPTISPTPSASPTSGVAACATTDQLDLQVSVSDNGNPGVPADYNPCAQAYLFPMFKIVNNNASAAVTVSNLSIVGWFNAVNGTASNAVSVDACCSGQAYRSWVYTALGAVDFTAMDTMSGVSATAVVTTGTYGSSGQQVTFTFQTAGVTIPAGEFLLAGGGNGFSSSTPFMQLSVPGADFDPTCSNYSNMTGGNGGVLYTPPSSPTAAYYENPGWVLYENGNQVCEYTATGTKDASSGVPAAGADCSCASEVGGGGGATNTPMNTATYTLTDTPIAGASSTDTPTVSATPTLTPTSGLPACATTDQLDLQVSVSDNGNPGVPADYNPCAQAYLFPMFKIVNNNASAAVTVSNLSIVGWFNAVNGTASNAVSVDACCSGQAYRSWVYTALGAVDFTAMDTMSGVSATAVVTTGTYGSSGQQVTFTFQTAGVTIPAGEFLLAGGGNGFSSSTPFMQLSVPGADFDPTCSNYSNMTGGNGGVLYTPPSSPTAAYYENPGWVLYENGNQVCEYTAPGTNDPSTGVPASGATCSCP